MNGKRLKTLDIAKANPRTSAFAPVDRRFQIFPLIKSLSVKLRVHLRGVLTAIALFLGFAQMWVSRGLLDPDGLSYSDIAKAYLRGDWHNALNSYWSPLYSWFLAIGYLVFRPGIRWEILVAHVINFIGFAAALFAWNWLLREWELWQGPPQHRVLVEVAGFSVITWAGLHLVTLGFTSADMEVLALTIAVPAVLVRVRRGVAGTSDFIFLGVALGIGFLAKAAFEALIPIFLLEAAILLHTVRDRRLYLAAGIAFLIPVSFITALSLSKGHFVISDTGKVNYSSHVTGMSLEGWKENGSWPGTKARHPITRLLDYPRVTGFESHPVGTFPLHFDPSWWWEGYPVAINWPRQLMVIRSNIGYCVTRFVLCPALIFAVVCVLCGAGLRMLRVFPRAWFIWFPGIAMLGVYCLVYTLNRYTSGPYCLIAFCLIASCWRVRLPRWIAAATAVLILLGCLSRKDDFVQTPRAFVKDVIGRGNPAEINDITLAETMKQAGLNPGDRVALVGTSLGVPWLGLLGATAVATVPETIKYNDRILGRLQFNTYEKSDAYWRSDAAAKQRVFDAFRGVGAKWILACNVPKWANTAGWKLAGHFFAADAEDRPEMFYQKID